jgi:hypothetical protein
VLSSEQLPPDPEDDEEDDDRLEERWTARFAYGR